MKLALVALLVLVGASCHKASPDENVYTGAKSKDPAGTSPTGTGSTGRPAPSGGFDKLALLRGVADCALDRFRDFEGHARTLRDAARAHAAARSDATQTSLRQAWLTTMASWQEAELFRIGPSASSTLAGGQDLRDQIDAWPLVSRCRIEEQIVSRLYAAPEFGKSLVNARGLAAIEYLAFYAGTDNACSTVSIINATGSWAAMSPEDQAQRKAEYARAVAEDIATHAAALLTAWEPSGGNFHAELATAGAGSRTYKRDADALNAVTAALFYVDLELKDFKLARPLGFDQCTKARCPELVESPYARVSTAHLKANMTAFRRAFEGCGAKGAGIGYDDWLRAVGAGQLADTMIAALAATRSSLDALDPPIEAAIETNPAPVEALYVTLKTLTVPMKTQMLSILDLDLPKTAEGDND